MLDFGHMGIYVRDIARMEAFYSRTLGLKVTDRGTFNGRDLVFLSGNAREHHQIVLASGRNDGKDVQVLNQISLKADSLDDLRSLAARLDEAGVPETAIAPVDHGTAWSLYFPDPDGNRIEVYTATPWYVPQPAAERLDLSLSDDEVAAATRTRYGNRPGFRPIGEWQADFADL